MSILVVIQSTRSVFKQHCSFYRYDCNKVPTLPLLPHARQNTIDYIPTPNPYTLRLISQPQYNTKLLTEDMAAFRIDPLLHAKKGLRQLGTVDPDNLAIKHQLSLKEISTSQSLSTLVRLMTV